MRTRFLCSHHTAAAMECPRGGAKGKVLLWGCHHAGLACGLQLLVVKREGGVMCISFCVLFFSNVCMIALQALHISVF